MTGFFDRLTDLLRGVAGSTSVGSVPRVTGAPPSGNGASSFHAFWDAPGGFVAVRATFEVRVAPSVKRLYFWALQADFVDGVGMRAGAGHLGLQWHPSYPGGTAVNWGGYDECGTILSGSASRLPGTLGNENTRDLDWLAERKYRLNIERAPVADQPDGALTAWRGSITDLEGGRDVVVRDLYSRGAALARPMVWSEVFADCDDQTVEVRWSDLQLRTVGGDELRPASVRLNYQSHEDGGCANTCTTLDDGTIVQRTAVLRTEAGGTRLLLPGD